MPGPLRDPGPGLRARVRRRLPTSDGVAEAAGPPDEVPTGDPSAADGVPARRADPRQADGTDRTAAP